MSLDEFIAELKEEVQRLVDKSCRVEINRVQKTNLGTLRTLNIFDEGRPVSVNFYMEIIYEEFKKGGKTVAELAGELVEAHYGNTARLQNCGIAEKFQNPDWARGRLFFRLINYGKNREMLKGMPHIKILDMALVYNLLADIEGDMVGRSRTSHEMFRSFDWDAGEMCRETLANTVRLFPEKVMSLYDMMAEMLGVTAGEGNTPGKNMEEGYPWTLTNLSGTGGATAIVYPGLLQKLAKETGFNLFLLPSSIHEFLIMPDKGDIMAEDLEGMVVKVNRDVVSPEEVLSDHAYYYDAGADSISIIGEPCEPVEIGGLCRQATAE